MANGMHVGGKSEEPRISMPGNDRTRRFGEHRDGEISSFGHSPGSEPSGIKSAGSPLKIRIPGRLLQRQKPVTLVNRESVESSVSSTSSTRRSLRCHASRNPDPT